MAENRYADVVAGVQATLGAYTQALDDGRTDDVVATYCADGSCDIPGLGEHHGHDALRAAYRKVEPSWQQRHLVANTVITEWNEHEASAVSDVVFLLRGDAGWSVQLVGRYRDRLHCSGGRWLFHHRAAEFLT